ncbi:MAG: heat-inducible transcription repressor HrcA [Chloroflexi bacterium]|nr:heat-inducible transcription repressor HrcA [Chloroflexota bacterium]
MEELTARQEAILALVIKQHIASALPIGSKLIAEEYLPSLSSATIRNEMAALEEAEFLTHPHTSAGRMPTRKGYQYFVQRLMQETSLSLSEQRRIHHQFHQSGKDLEEWMRLSAAVLAHATQVAGWVAAPRVTVSRLKHVQLLSIRERVVLLVIVLDDGTVRQGTLAQPAHIGEEELQRLTNQLNAEIGSRTASQIHVYSATLEGFAGQIAARIIDHMHQVDRWTEGQIYLDGVVNMLQQPEFAGHEKAQSVLEQLDQELILSVLEDLGIDFRGITIIIGSEGEVEPKQDFGIVLARYGVSPEAFGALGLVGPIRLPYERGVSLVRYMADLLSKMVADTYGYNRSEGI